MATRRMISSSSKLDNTLAPEMSAPCWSSLGRRHWLIRLGGPGLLFKVGIGDVLGLMRSQRRPQDRQLLAGLEPPEALGGLQHGGAGPAQHHLGIPPAFDVAADLADGAVHVLNDVGARERAA